MRVAQAGKLPGRLLDRCEIARQFFLRQRARLGQNFVHGAGVTVHAIHQEFVMKMWPRRRACGSHRANHRTLLNAVSLFDLQFVQVEIVRFKLLAMLMNTYLPLGRV